MFRRVILLGILLALALVLVGCGAAGAKTVEKIQKDKFAYVGTVPFEAPLMYQVGGELVGPDAELGNRIVARIQEGRVGPGSNEIRLTWINRTYAGLPAALLNGEVDFVVGVFAITEERRKEIDFSDPYYTSELVLIVNPIHKDLTPGNLTGATIGVREGTGVEAFAKQNFASSTLQPFKTLDDAVLALRRSEVDAVIDDRYMAAYALATVPGVAHLELVPETIGTVEVAVGLKKRDNALKELVNGVITEMKNEGVFAQLAEEHVADYLDVVNARRTERLDMAKKAAEPRQIKIRVSKDKNFDMDIYRMANLRFVFKDSATGSSYSTSQIGFQGSVGVASANVPPGSYLLSLPKFNFSTPVQIDPSDAKVVPINIRLTSGGVVVRKG
jgi:ABC-type amino acid transport substrate-binding protein